MVFEVFQGAVGGYCPYARAVSNGAEDQAAEHGAVSLSGITWPSTHQRAPPHLLRASLQEMDYCKLWKGFLIWANGQKGGKSISLSSVYGRGPGSAQSHGTC